jgi:CHASE2 domain-containing sensor protein
MFSVNSMAGVDAALLTETMNQWKEFWLLPAGMAAAIMVLFFLTFWDRLESKAQAAPGTDAADLQH